MLWPIQSTVLADVLDDSFLGDSPDASVAEGFQLPAGQQRVNGPAADSQQFACLRDRQQIFGLFKHMVQTS